MTKAYWDIYSKKKKKISLQGDGLKLQICNHVHLSIYYKLLLIHIRPKLAIFIERFKMTSCWQDYCGDHS